MNRKLLTYSNITLEYFTRGNGAKGVLLFPGFGRTAEEFMDLMQTKDPCLFIAINHVYVGNSIVKNDDLIDKSDFIHLIDLILEKEIEKNAEIDIIAYSMGGRLALCYLEQVNTRITRTTLLAPDGLFINGWQKLTGKKIGRFIFREVIIKRPKTFFAFVKFLRILRLIPTHLPKFLKFHLDTSENRMLVYKVWSTTSRLIPDHDKIKQTHTCQFDLILGKHDKTIPLQVAEIFKKQISSEVDVLEVESGHDLMKVEVLQKIGH